MKRDDLFAGLTDMMARPFIPELHRDDCADPACVRCEPRTSIERLDVPPAVVAAEAVLLQVRARHTAAKDWDEAELIANAEAIQLVTHPNAPVSTDRDYPGWTPGRAT